MKLAVYVIVSLCCISSSAIAQTAADLQAYAQEVATQNGVPWDIFKDQIQAESGWNANVGCNSYGACGIAQIKLTTAANPGYGLSPVDPNDPMASLKFAAQYDAALYQKTGSWQTALSGYSGLSPQAPGDYGSVFAAAASADGGAVLIDPMGQGAIITSPDVTNSSASPTTISSTPQALNSSFTWLWNNTVGTTQSATENLIRSVQLMVMHYLLQLLQLAVLILAVRVGIGDANWYSLGTFILRMAIVVASITAGSTLYNQYVVQPVMGLPSWWQAWVVTGTGGTGDGVGASPVAILDAVYNGVWAAAIKALRAMSPWSPGHAVTLGIAAIGAIFMADVGCWLMYIARWATTLLSYVALIVGPIIIPFMMFRATRTIVHSWFWALGTLLLTMFTVDIIMALWQVIMVKLLSTVTITGTPDTDMPGVLQLGVVIFCLGAGVGGGAWLAGRVFGGAVERGMEGAAQSFLSGAAIRDGVMIPVNATRRFLGI